MDVSVIIPCYNEGNHLQDFIKALRSAITPITSHYEIILVNDGSKDNTKENALELISNGDIRYLEFSRNFGKEAALMAGIDHATGDATLLIDADFQHPLDKIQEMAQLWQSGYEMIYGVIANRQGESLSKRLGTKTLYALLNTSDIAIPENAGDFRWLDRKVVDALKNLPERNRFMKGLYAWVGFKSIALPFIPADRAGGISSFSLKNLSKLALSGLTAFSTLPLRMWTIIGAFISLASILYGIYVALDTVINGNPVGGWPTLAVALMLFSGVQLLSIGILGEYIGRIFNEVKQEERVNDPNNDPKNIISSLFYDYYKDLKITASEIPTILKTPSITFSSFSKDTVGNQMTIVVESWGAFADSVLQDRFQASLIHIFNKEGYGVTTGLTKYFGSTTAAGMRELTNSNGGYGYYMNPQNAKSHKSIFNYKNEQGYETFAFHPFTGRMFSRSIWWKNLGANHIYFRDNYVVEHPLSANNIDEEAHFPSVKDEAFFDYINDKTKNISKKYVYFLTVNSHLPYKHHTQEIHPDTSLLIKNLPISEEAQSQLSHIKNFIVYVAQHLNPNHCDKVIIVGDHLPPFPGLRERRFYKEGKVPYLVIEKIK